MTLRDVMRGWALTHRDAAIERVQQRRTALRFWESRSVSRGTFESARADLRRAERSLAFWDDLYTRLSRGASR